MVSAQLAELSKLGIASDPAPGDIHQICGTRNTLKTIADDSRGILGTLNALSTSTIDGGWEGDSAQAFVEKFSTLRTLLGHLERMHLDAYDVLDEYVRRLDQLQREVAEALARARAHWNDQARAKRDEEQHASARRALRDQVARLRRESAVCADPMSRQQVMTELQDVERRERAASRSESSARDLVSRYQRSLDSERDGLGEIRRRFLRLDEETAARLRCLVPEALENYNVVIGFLRSAGTVLAGLRDMITAALEWVRKHLERLGDFLLYFAIAVAALIVLLAVVGTGGALIPVLLLVLAKTLVALTYVNALESSAVVMIFLLQLAGSETGDPVRLVDLAFAALDLVAVSKGLMVMRTLAKSKGAIRGFHEGFSKFESPLDRLIGGRVSGAAEKLVPRHDIDAFDDLAETVISEVSEPILEALIDMPLRLGDMAENLQEWVRGNPNGCMPRPILIPIIVMPVPVVIHVHSTTP